MCSYNYGCLLWVSFWFGLLVTVVVMCLLVALAVAGLVIRVLMVIVDLVAACLRVFWLVDFGFILTALFASCGSGLFSG